MVVLGATASAASAQSWSLEAGAAQSGDIVGGELGVGYRFVTGPIVITPTVGAFLYQGDNDRYRFETFSNGNTVCRDGSNGEFADDRNCDNTAVEAYGRVEAVYRFDNGFEIGGGYRVSGESAAFGTVAFQIGEGVALKGEVGSDYYGARIVLHR